MDKQDKPLSEWTLGEAKTFCEKRTESQDWEGLGAECEGCPLNVVCAITASEWDLKEAPRLTEQEIAIMRAVGAKWLSRGTGEAYVDLWVDEPVLATTDKKFYARNGTIARVHTTKMPSVKSGDCIGLEEAEK